MKLDQYGNISAGMMTKILSAVRSHPDSYANTTSRSRQRAIAAGRNPTPLLSFSTARLPSYPIALLFFLGIGSATRKLHVRKGGSVPPAQIALSSLKTEPFGYQRLATAHTMSFVSKILAVSLWGSRFCGDFVGPAQWNQDFTSYEGEGDIACRGLHSAALFFCSPHFPGVTLVHN